MARSPAMSRLGLRAYGSRFLRARTTTTNPWVNPSPQQPATRPCVTVVYHAPAWLAASNVFLRTSKTGLPRKRTVANGCKGSRVRVRRSNSGYGMLAPSGALDETQTKGREIGPLHPLVHVSANPCRIGFVSACEDSLEGRRSFCIEHNWQQYAGRARVAGKATLIGRPPNGRLPHQLLPRCGLRPCPTRRIGALRARRGW